MLVQIKDPRKLVLTGCIALVLGSLSVGLHRSVPSLPGNMTDGITGFFYGVAIATLLLGVRLNARRRSTGRLAPRSSADA